jgi:DNA-binding SARP family transcriptional activator
MPGQPGCPVHADPALISMRLLGAFALRIGQQDVSLTPNAQRLLAYLALERRWTPRTTVATTLWPGTAPARAGGNLRSALWRITRAVGRVIVTVHAQSVRLDEDVDVDAVHVERGANRCAESRTPVPEPLDVDLLSVDLLPGWTDEWVVIHRECFRQVRLRALESLCAHHRRVGQLRQAMDLALTAVSAEPLRESAHRQLVQVHLAEGNVAEAVRQYDVYRRMLRQQLGLVPSPVMRQLVAPLLACPARPT